MLTPTQTTPLLLPSEYTQLTHQIVDDPEDPDYELSRDANLRLLIEASDAVQRYCGRRFDERRDTRKYIAASIRQNGALVDGQRSMQLDDDLKQVLTLAQDVPTTATVASDGTVIAAGDYMPIGGKSIYNDAVIRKLVLVSGGFITAATNIESIWVDGIWGCGGRWVKTGAKLDDAIDDSAEEFDVDAVGRLEAGMVLRFGTTNDYAYCLDVADTTVTVDRSYNGSTAEDHDADDILYYWQAMDMVRGLVRRLVTWAVEQIKSPVAGTVTIGDFSYPVDTSGLPKDLFIAIGKSGLKRMGDVKRA